VFVKGQGEPDGPWQISHRAILWALTLTVFLPLLFVVGILALRVGRPVEVRVTDRHLEVTGQYGVTLSLHTIVEASLEPTMPRRRRRLRGFRLGELRNGRFRVETLGEGMFYTRTNSTPQLLARTPSTFVLINFRDAGRTRALHAELTTALRELPPSERQRSRVRP